MISCRQAQVRCLFVQFPSFVCEFDSTVAQAIPDMVSRATMAPNLGFLHHSPLNQQVSPQFSSDRQVNGLNAST
jgi:hypothetical protein